MTDLLIRGLLLIRIAGKQSCYPQPKDEKDDIFKSKKSFKLKFLSKPILTLLVPVSGLSTPDEDDVTPCSSNTVVQTPHRQSIAEASAPGNVALSQASKVRFMSDIEAQESSKSFLDMRVQEENDPGGELTRSRQAFSSNTSRRKHSKTVPELELSTAISSEMNEVDPVTYRNGFQYWTPSVEAARIVDGTQQLQHGGNDNAQAPQPMDYTTSETPPLTMAAESSRTTSSTCIRRQLFHNRPGRNVRGTILEQASDLLPRRAWPPRLPTSPLLSKQERAWSAAAGPPVTSLTKAKIEEDMMTLKHRMAVLDGTISAVIGRRSRSGSDREWIKKTVQDITARGDEVREEYAFIPITTTTGCNQETARVSATHSQQRGSEGSHLEVLTGTRAGSRSTYGNLTSCQSNPTWSTLLKLGLATLGPVADTMSTESLTRTTDDKESNVADLSALSRDRRLTTMPQSGTPPRSTSTPRQDTERGGSGSWRSSHMRKVRGHQIPLELNPWTLWPGKSKIRSAATVPMPLTNAKGASLGTRRGAVQNEAREIPGVALAARVPGTYPSHLDAEEDIVIHSTKNQSEIARDEDLAYLVDCKRLMLMMSRYWYMASPLFNFDSAFWQRLLKHESTWKDSIALVAAIPGALLGTTFLVWGLKILAHVGICLGSVLQFVGAEVLFLMRA